MIGNYIKAVAGGTSISTATLMKTGQTTSYRTGDDGDLEAGRNVDFFTLAENNPFGNTDRFTDELGGTAYANDIVIDWSTFNGSTVLGYKRTDNGVNINWNDAIDGALATSIGTFTSGWRLPNINEIISICNWSLLASRYLGYSPFLFVTASIYWSSTTYRISTTAAHTFANNTAVIQGTSKTTTSSMRYFAVRTFTVTGTTLS